MAAERGRDARGQRPLGEQTLPVFRIRDLPMKPERGEEKDMFWRQYTETVQLRLLLRGDEWEGVQESEFEVRVCPTELAVKCKGRCKDSALESISGKLRKEINPKGCWFALERDFSEPLGKNRVLVVELAKKLPGKPWADNTIFHDVFFNRRNFGWNAQQTPEIEQGEAAGWMTIRAGRRRDLEDPFVTSRGWLCTEFEQGQTNELVFFRVILDQKALDRCLEKVPFYRLFALDCSEKYLKLFVRGDESTPVLLGELGGKVIAEEMRLELTQVTREVEGHRIRGTMETLPCIDVTLLKAPDSQGEWQELLASDEEVLSQPQGSLEEYQEQQLRLQREPSPDREDWTPDDWADEQKDKADAAFKAGNFKDAIVYYTRALRFTPQSEKLLSNRCAAYLKISKFQLALEDAAKAESIEPNWPKIFFRKGQALRGLKRFKDAILAFAEGKDLDPGNPEWQREIQKTRDVQAAVEDRKVNKGR